jgi:hypothetical protein
MSPEIRDHLVELENAVGRLSKTWKPDDARYRADFYRQIMQSLSFAYFVYFHADAEHPDWSPLWNPVYTLQPNPDDIYLYSPIRGDLTYRVAGNRGTVALLTFTTSDGMSGLVGQNHVVGHHNDLDDRDLTIGPDGEFELLFSTQRPEGYGGNWAPMAQEATVMMIRYRSVDWSSEIDPQLTIECLDPVPPKARLSIEEIAERIQLMAGFPDRRISRFLDMQNGIRDRVGVNAFEPARYQGGLSKQVYWPAVFELHEGEALVIETELPKVCPYWNIQLNDPYFNAIEFVYRLSSINGATARLSSDGKLRAVIALTDPHVPNWLDPAGFTEGTIYGRWYDCDTNPVPSLTRVEVQRLPDYLPSDTPVVTEKERAEELTKRVRAAQRRRRW